MYIRLRASSSRTSSSSSSTGGDGSLVLGLRSLSLGSLRRRARLGKRLRLELSLIGGGEGIE